MVVADHGTRYARPASARARLPKIDEREIALVLPERCPPPGWRDAAGREGLCRPRVRRQGPPTGRHDPALAKDAA